MEDVASVTDCCSFIQEDHGTSWDYLGPMSSIEKGEMKSLE